ncbi:MAG: SGNH/GDSL hydrolase family protein [Spirochaetes bacterium]|nr:SGNH/GDSL hydrolase family protein [Spirochaetota bacterium]
MSAIKNNDTILFQGDSITDCGRVSAADNLGGGYVAMIRGYLQVRHADKKLTILNRGVGGNRTTELLERWDADCVALKPDVLSISIGVNDVWRLRGMWNNQTYVTIDEYKANYRKLIDRALAGGVRQLVLMSPTTITEDNDTELARLLDERTESVIAFAKEYKAVYVPAREAQKKAIREAKDVRWTSDGCHPTTAGHALLAAAWLSALGL